MKLTPVKSSNISAHGYDPVSKTLAVRFTSGALYHYADVPAATAEAFAKAESLGSHFAREIRGKFTHTEVKA